MLTYPVGFLNPKVGGAFPAVIEDGNTVAWYLSDDLTTITKDGGDLVSRWNDKLGSGHDLIQASGTNQPLWVVDDGVLFDGIDNYMKTANFTLIQPEQIYIVFKQITWTSNRYVFDGNVAASGAFRQSPLTPQVQITAGTSLGTISPALNTFVIVRVLFNSLNSELILNNNTPIAGSAGTKNMGGFTLGSHSGVFNFSNMQVKEIILRKIADSAQDEQDIYDYLASKYSI